MKKRASLILLLLGVMLFSAFTVRISAEPEKISAGLPTEIIVGGVFPIVQRPDAGPDRRDGFLIAVYEINNQSGANRILPENITLKPIVKDDDNSAAGGTQAAKDLIAEGAHVVIGSSGSSVSAAMSTELTPSKIVQISYASSSPSLSDRTKYPYFTRVCASDADQGKAINDLVQKFGWTKGAAISTSDSYGMGLIDIFKTAFEADGGSLLTRQSFDAGATDVSAEVQAIKDAKPEFVVGNFIDVDASTCMKKANDLGIDNIPWIMTDGWSTTATYAKDTDVKAAMQLAIGTTPAPITAPAYATFNQTWFNPKWNFLETPKKSQDTNVMFNAYAPFAYDAVYVAAKALAAANDTAGDVLLPEVKKVTHDGASGKIVFNNLGEVVGRYDYVQLKEETYTSFGRYDIPSGKTAAEPILDDTATLALQDGSEWEIKDNAITLTKSAVTPTPGFEIFGLLFGMACLVVTLKRRK